MHLRLPIGLFSACKVRGSGRGKGTAWSDGIHHLSVGVAMQLDAHVLLLPGPKYPVHRTSTSISQASHTLIPVDHTQVELKKPPRSLGQSGRLRNKNVVKDADTKQNVKPGR